LIHLVVTHDANANLQMVLVLATCLYSVSHALKALDAGKVKIFVEPNML